MEADPLEIARAWATPGYCRSCLREQATEADWKHKGGCECARCASLCWEERGCFDERGGEDPQGTLARALLAKHAEVGRLREALERIIPIMENASRDAFKNGVTDPTGSIDQGDVWAGNAIDAARAALAQEGTT